MAVFYPGRDVSLTFSVPDLNGNNVEGLAWSLGAMAKDGDEVTSGAEYASVAVDTGNSNFYKLSFTPDSGSTSTYMLRLSSDASIPDIFEEIFEPSWEEIIQLAKTTHSVGTPETITYLLPDGSELKQFTITKSGALRTSTPS